MKTQKNIRILLTILLSACLGISLLFIPFEDKRLSALLGMLAFAVFFYGLFYLNKSQLSIRTNLIAGNIWSFLFPIPYVLTHLWTLPTLPVIFTFVVGSFLGYWLFFAPNVKIKFGAVLFAVLYYLLFYFWLYPICMDIGLSFV